MIESVIIVPGYTPAWTRRPLRLHREAARRVQLGLAVARHRGVPWLMFCGGAVRPAGTEFVEAEQMRDEALRLGWDPRFLIVEGRSRTTMTNLRNAGRLMLDRGWSQGRVVTSRGHCAYIAFPGASGLRRRTLGELGYLPGRLRWAGGHECVFEPDERVRRHGPDPRDP